MRKIIQFFRAIIVIFRLGGPEKVLELAKKAFYDPLTGLYNYGALEEIGKREVERAKRYKHSLAVVFLDLDNFKPINDKLGHSAGNEVLIETANFLREICRAADIVARYGGDEFVVLAPETDRIGAERIVKKIKAKTLFIEATSGEKIAVEISYGVAVWHEGLSFTGLLHEADLRMYKEKNNSKDKRREKR